MLVSLCQFSLPGWKPSSGVGASVMSSIVEAGWRVGANKRATLTRKHILVRVAVVGKWRDGEVVGMRGRIVRSHHRRDSCGHCSGR